jgi:hypothetical protein
MTIEAKRAYAREHYAINRNRYIENVKRWRLANRERSRANNRASKRRRSRPKTEHEMELARSANARYRAKIRKNGHKKPLTDHQRMLEKTRKARYEEKKKVARRAAAAMRPPKVKAPPVPYILSALQKEHHREKKKQWHLQNRERVNANRRNLLRVNLSARIAATFRSRLSAIIASGKAVKTASVLTLLGCTITEFIAHIERQFLPGMTWQNYGREGWEIDHVIPCASFNLSDEGQQKRCFHHSNLQPLWGFDNRSKGDKNFIRLLA